ncbi:MarR family transcriptional regulator [Candidatus Woesearchaeota archaeon]|nr:MarR family transcriptional regulator [Candidatus Woesearchaeota archaeon]
MKFMPRIARKEQVIEILKQHPEGLTIEDLAEKLKTTRHTVSLVLAELKGEKKVRIRKVAAAKLHYWK